MRQVTACFRNRLRTLLLLENQTQFRCFSGPISQSPEPESESTGPLRKTPAQGRRFTSFDKGLRAISLRYFRPSTSCASPGRTNHDIPSMNTMKDQLPIGDRAVSAPWISSGDIAPIHPSRLPPASHYPASSVWLRDPVRHPYRSYPPTLRACYLACACSVNPLN